MIGIWSKYTDIYLYVTAAMTIVTFGIPITFMPFRWAKFFGWRLPQETDLALYFGRCLGAVVLVVVGFAIYVARVPAAQGFFLSLLIALCWSMVLIHIWGAVQKVQPKSETIEIFFWALSGILPLCFYPVQGAA